MSKGQQLRRFQGCFSGTRLYTKGAFRTNEFEHTVVCMYKLTAYTSSCQMFPLPKETPPVSIRSASVYRRCQAPNQKAHLHALVHLENKAS